jgi:hypothetical protein
MFTKKRARRTTKARTLPVRESSKVKGGAFLSSSLNNVLKTIGEGVATVARKS